MVPRTLRMRHLVRGLAVSSVLIGIVLVQAALAAKPGTLLHRQAEGGKPPADAATAAAAPVASGSQTGRPAYQVADRSEARFGGFRRASVGTEPEWRASPDADFALGLLRPG